MRLAAAFRTSVQLGSLRFRNLLDRWRGAMGKLPLPFLAPRLLRSLHPFPTSERRRLAFPSSLQLLRFFLNLFNNRHSLSQLLLQFSDPLILRFQKFCVGLLIRLQFTISCSSFARVFLPLFSIPLTLYKFLLSDAKQVQYGFSEKCSCFNCIARRESVRLFIPS